MPSLACPDDVLDRQVVPPGALLCAGAVLVESRRDLLGIFDPAASGARSDE